MVSHLLGAADIDGQIEELVLEKTEGIPFFIEEFIKSLKDLKIIEASQKTYHLVKDIKHITIPSTIQEVIMSRVDSLPENSKDLLQIGSAIEREFTYETIKRVAELPEKELLSYLSVLKDSELIYERGIYPQSSYIFKHALTQEVVYDSILGKRKKILHEKIGKVIEALCKDNIDEHYGVLSDHFIKAENYEKGAKYSKLAGRTAIKKSAFGDAISYAQKVIFCFEKLPSSDSFQKNIIDARTKLSAYFMMLNFHVEAKNAVAPILDLALKLNYRTKLPTIYIAIGSYSIYVEEDYPKGFEELQKAITISEEIGDFPSYFLACYFLGSALCFDCDFEKGLSYLMKSLDLVKAANQISGIVIVKSTIGIANYLFQGKIDPALKTSEESLHEARKCGDMHCEGMAHSIFGMCCFHRGLFEKAENELLEAVILCEKTMYYSWGGWANLFLGEIYFDRGEYKKAWDYYNQAALSLKRTGTFPSYINLFEIIIAKIRVINMDEDFDLKLISNFMAGIKSKDIAGWSKRLFAEVLLNMGDQHISEADDWIRQAIEADQRNGTMFQLAKDYALYADLFKRKKDIRKAKETLTKAIEIFKECGADGWVEKYAKELAGM